jgi:hypothetical protein
VISPHLPATLKQSAVKRYVGEELSRDKRLPRVRHDFVDTAATLIHYSTS